MKYHLISLLCAGLFMNCNYAAAATQSNVVVCKQAYALCTSAPCVPDPRHPGFAICSCVMEDGDSAGYSSCEDRAPKDGKFKTKHVVSTFSFEQFNTKKNMTCPAGTPWTNCLDAPCTVNPMDNTKALCSCKISHEQSFVTFGGECNVKTCATGFWSGATVPASISLRNALLNALNISKNPWPNIACPITTD